MIQNIRFSNEKEASMKDDKMSRDDFWDLRSLLPQKRPPVMHQPSTDTEPVTVEVGEPDASKDTASLSLRFREVKPTDRRSREVKPAERNRNLLEYVPDHGLIKKVTILRWYTKYSFYEQFRFDAVRCKAIEGKRCAHVPFFSYTPQYRQMNQSQLEYYFYWRSECRRGIFHEADFAYVLLYIYEIINVYTPSADLSDNKNDASFDEKSFALDMLTSIWLNYRGKYKALDKYLSEWLPDFCLINRLPPPTEKLSPILPAIMATASLREFFISDAPLAPSSLIAFSCSYDWKKSKYISEGSDELRSEFQAHIEGALRAVSEAKDKRFNSDSLRTVRASRDAFCGSLCAHSIKRRIDIEYVSFSRSVELRSLVTAVVKYSENKLRAHFGIKSRLKVDGLDDAAKAVIDAYFLSVYPSDRHCSSKTEEKLREERYYDEMYGALSVGIDEAEAKRLEDISWSVTERLTADDYVEAEAKYEPSPDEYIPKIENAAPIEVDADFCDVPELEEKSSLSALHLDVLGKIHTSAPDEAAEICRREGRYLDEIVSEINEYAVDSIGDVLIETENGAYVTIDDYADEIGDILQGN